MTLSQPGRRRSANGTMKLVPPALFTTMSMWPSRSIPAVTAAVTASSLVTSAGMTKAFLPCSPIRRAVPARPSSLRATRARSAPAAAIATAIARPIPREAPVTKAVFPVRSKGLALIGILPLGRQRPSGRIDPAHDLVQHNTHIRLAHPQVLGPFPGDNLRLRHPGEPAPGLIRLQVVVQFGHQGGQRPPGRRPGIQVRVTGPAKRWRDQDRALHGRVIPPHQRQLRAERPAGQPQPRQPRRDAVADRGGHILAFGLAATELTVAGALLRRGATRVEPQD